MYCEYYQATTLKKKTWFLSACLRNEDNLVFARGIKGNGDRFEFFVPKDQLPHFLAIIQTLMDKGIVLSLEKKPNRLEALASKALATGATAS